MRNTKKLPCSEFQLVWVTCRLWLWMLPQQVLYTAGDLRCIRLSHPARHLSYTAGCRRRFPAIHIHKRRLRAQKTQGSSSWSQLGKCKKEQGALEGNLKQRRRTSQCNQWRVSGRCSGWNELARHHQYWCTADRWRWKVPQQDEREPLFYFESS